MSTDGRANLPASDDAPSLRPVVIREPVTAAAAQAAESPGAVVGNYQLIEKIGEGGFGQVFHAEQREPVFRRVALKILRPGMDSSEVLARFEAERQAMARMDHPGIAKVLDAGATPSGRPFFVMELIQGDPITTYCDKNKLPVPERLRLFCDVCAAAHHAHQKGIIHRDLKPSNILVSSDGGQGGRPRATIIDFGVAKAISGRLTDRTVFTEFRQFIGTPEYMSPEQTLGGGIDIDTRTDIYSLGVMLFELLTGTTPLDPKSLRSASIGDIERLIRDAHTPRPSSRLSTLDERADVAEQRRTEHRRLTGLLRGDLDWIVLKALDKDRNRRYESVAALGEDVRRFLDNEPVAARPPSVTYLASKFVRRHRVVVTAAALIGAALVVSVIGTSTALLHARRQRDKAVEAEALASVRLAETLKAKEEADVARAKAERSSAMANAVTEFFTWDVLDLTPTPAGTPERTVRQLLDAIPEKIDQHFKSEPGIEGIIRERVGQLYRRLGEIEKSSTYLADAIPLLEKGLGPDNKQTLSAIHRLGELNMDREQFDQAVDLFDRAYQGRLKYLGLEYSLTMNSLGRRGAAKVYAGRIDDGFRDLDEVYQYYVKKYGKTSRSAVVTGGNISDAYIHVGRASDARTLARELLDTILTTKGQLSGLEWGMRVSLGNAYSKLGEHDEAMVQLDQAKRITDSIYPPNHYQLVSLKRVRGVTLGALKRYPEARAELESAYSISLATFPKGSEPRQIAKELVDLSEREGDAEAAEQWREKAKGPERPGP